MTDHAQRMRSKALSLLGCGYVYGATGWICTRARLEQQAAQYPQYADLIFRYGPKWLGKPCYDCAQLTRVVAKEAGVSLPSGSNSQWNARGVWTEKGRIADMPDEAGLFLFTVRESGATHTGVSIGGGEEIDARGHAYGVVRRKIEQTSFTHYARLATGGDSLPKPLPDAQQEPRPTLKSGAKGDAVRALQERLLSLGYDMAHYGADGYFGAKTQEAVRAFQRANGLDDDGIVGAKTRAALDAAPEKAAASGEKICVDAQLLRALLPALERAEEEGEEMRILLGAGDFDQLRRAIDVLRA